MPFATYTYMSHVIQMIQWTANYKTTYQYHGKVGCQKPHVVYVKPNQLLEGCSRLRIENWNVPRQDFGFRLRLTNHPQSTDRWLSIAPTPSINFIGGSIISRVSNNQLPGRLQHHRRSFSKSDLPDVRSWVRTVVICPSHFFGATTLIWQ